MASLDAEDNDDEAVLLQRPGGLLRGGGGGLRWPHLDLDVMDGLEVDALLAVAAANPNHLGPAAFAGRVGLAETALTRALVTGDFVLAEHLVTAARDPEYLNEGLHSATPLNLALTGRTMYLSGLGQPRHLKLARLLVRRGANVNLRIPNHDFDTASESPLELLVRYYLDLLRTFGKPDSEANSSRSSNREYEVMDLLDTIGLSGETNMSPAAIITQTRELIDFFLDHGADINLQTTVAGRTVFHMVLAAEATDDDLVERMVLLSALVNLTDVHGTTPIMDVVKCREKERAPAAYNALSQMGKRLLLDAQNCSGESALWRSMFTGNTAMSHLLLDEGAASFTMARVQEDFSKRPTLKFTSYFRRRPSISNLPALLAPVLGNSPSLKAHAKLHNSAAKNKQSCSSSRLASAPGSGQAFLATVFNAAVGADISPLVDQGWFCTREVERTLHELLKAHTAYKHLTEDKVFGRIAIIPLLFGRMSGGLRQLCIRKIFNTVLFNDKAMCKTTLDILWPGRDSRRRKQPPHGHHQDHHHPYRYRCRSEPREWRDADHGDSACVMASASAFSDNNNSDADAASAVTPAFHRLALSEPEMESSTEAAEAASDNWLLCEDPSYTRHRIRKSLEMGVELEISRQEEEDDEEADVEDPSPIGQELARDEGRSHADPVEVDLITAEMLLQESKNALQRIEALVSEDNGNGGDGRKEADISDEGNLLTADMLLQQSENTLQRIEALEARVAEDSSHGVGRATSPVVAEPRPAPRVPESRLLVRLNNSVADSQDSSSASSRSSSSSGDEISWECAFSLRHTLRRATANQSRSSESASCSARHPGHAKTAKALTPAKMRALAEAVGLPPGVSNCFQLEAARVQLGLAVFNHHSIDCDRGCEGDDDDDSSSDSSATGWDAGGVLGGDGLGSLSEPSLTDTSESAGDDVDDSSLDDVESDYSFEASVPARPRVLSSSSEEEENGATPFEMRIHDLSTRFVRDFVVDPSFEASTESDTAGEEDPEVANATEV